MKELSSENHGDICLLGMGKYKNEINFSFQFLGTYLIDIFKRKNSRKLSFFFPAFSTIYNLHLKENQQVKFSIFISNFKINHVMQCHSFLFFKLPITLGKSIDTKQLSIWLILKKLNDRSMAQNLLNFMLWCLTKLLGTSTGTLKNNKTPN